MSVGDVREGVLGAAEAKGLRVIDGGKASRKCPVTALGHLDGHFYFMDVGGQFRRLSAEQLGKRSPLMGLFHGNSDWLAAAFPKVRKVVTKTPGGDVVTEEVVGIGIAVAGEHLMAMAARAGLYGEHVKLRQVGIWADTDGSPVAHCGDAVLMAGKFRDSGFRSGDQVWVQTPEATRPAPACGPEIGRRLQEDLRDLWDWRQPGGEIIALGWICVALYGAAARWRPNLFIIGQTGSGKSALTDVMRACLPIHHYTNDTSKAGIEGAVNGRAMPVMVDEASDRSNREGIQALLDVVLSASGGDGTRGSRGDAGGGVRTFNVVCSIVYASINPPEMQPQHLSRFSMLELALPEQGADHRDAHGALAASTAQAAPALWGRAIAGFGRWRAALTTYRDALGRTGCRPREMDHFGALLAGWWVMTSDGEPSERDALEGVSAIAEYVRRAEDVDSDGGPRRVLQVLLSSLVQRDRSTDQEQVGTLLDQAFGDLAYEISHRDHVAKLLSRNGIRPIRHDEINDHKGLPVPRMGEGAGIWLSRYAEPLRALFKGTDFAGDRWFIELSRLPTARKSTRSVRVGGLSGRALWIGAKEFDDSG